MSTRVAVLTLLPLACLGIIFAMFWISSARVAGELGRSRAELRISLETKAFRDKVIATELAFDAFLAEPAAPAYARLGDSRDNMRAAFDQIARGQQASGGAAAIGELSPRLEALAKVIDVALGAAIAIGFDEDSGLGGAVNKAGSGLDHIVADEVDLSDPLGLAMAEAYQKLRRHQIRFALMRNAAAREDVLGAAATMRKDMDASFFSDAKKAAIGDPLNDYMTKFSAWADREQDLVAAQVSAKGYFRALSEAADKQVLAASQTVDDAQIGLTATEEAAVRFVGGVILAVTVLCGCLGLMIGRGISRPIRKLAVAMEHLAGGDLAVPVAGTEGRDEVGTMARAVLTFKMASTEKLRLEDAAARDRDAAEAERVSREREKSEEHRQAGFTVAQLGQGLVRLAAGDLMVRIDTPFEARAESLRENFNAAAEKLQAALAGVNTDAQTIRGRTVEIAKAADNLSQRTELQAARLAETAASLGEITQRVHKAAASTNGARSIAAAAKAEAAKTNHVVQKAIDAMGGIDASSRQISTIIGVVDEIAFQTNLLALNAGVEAARAGNAGLGFAVVAAEVRALAQRSATAAKEIKTLLSSSTIQVEQGVELVDATGQALDRISVQIADLDAAMAEISTGAGHQASGLQAIHAAVSDMDLITQQNAVMVEQTTSAVYALQQETENLTTVVGRFKIGARKENFQRQASHEGSARPSSRRVA